MPANALQELCDQGQLQLMRTSYLDAAQTLAQAEQIAWDARDFDTLARLYLPLQEARRQIRQRCGEGAVQMHLLASGPLTSPTTPTPIRPGQLLLAGWGTIVPAVALRHAMADTRIYAETFLAAVYPSTDHSRWIVLVPREDLSLPAPSVMSVEMLKQSLPPGCVILTESQLPTDVEQGTADSYAAVMALWEQLHTPLLHLADSEPDPVIRMQMYREILQVDPACELAHQHLSHIAREMVRTPHP